MQLAALDMAAPEHEAVPQLMRQLREVGFVLVRNVPGFDEGRLLEACRALHAAPAHVKRSLEWQHHNKPKPVPGSVPVHRQRPVAPGAVRHGRAVRHRLRGGAASRAARQ